MGGFEDVERFGHGLTRVRVTSEELLGTLQVNRMKHLTAYNATIAAWAKDMAKHLHAAARALDKNPEQDMQFLFRLPPRPVAHTEEYDDAIAVVTASMDKEFVLNEKEFRRYWLDKWDWKSDFDMSVSNYLGKPKR